MGRPTLTDAAGEAGIGDRADARRGRVIAKDNGAMDFIANATGAIYAKCWTPAVQKLFAGQISPEDVLKTVQADYEQQVSSGG